MSAGVASYALAEYPQQGRAVRRRVRSRILSGTAADHQAIYNLLKEVFCSPSRTEFKASLEDPFYEPSDRLLLRRNLRIMGHVHLTHRVMQFGPLQVPVAGLGWLAVAPQARYEGLGTHLLSGAERQMAQDGALVGLLRTKIPHFFRHTGWALCGRHRYSMAGTHAVVGSLLDRGLWRPRNSRFMSDPCGDGKRRP